MTRKIVHLIDAVDGNFTACGRWRYTLHTDSIAAVTCKNCWWSTQARREREG